MKYFLKIFATLAVLFLTFACNANLSDNNEQMPSVVILGKAVSLPNELVNSRATVNTNNVNDVTNYYTIENNILTFDTTRGPSYQINLIEKTINACTSSGAIMSSCLEVEPKLWEITLYSDELPMQVTYRFNEEYKTTKQVCGSGGTASGLYDTSWGRVDYMDGTYEEISVNNINGEIELYYGKNDIPVYYRKTTVNKLLEYGVTYELINPDKISILNDDEQNGNENLVSTSTIIRLDDAFVTACYIYEDFFMFDFCNGALFKISFEGEILYTSECIPITEYSLTYGVDIKNFEKSDTTIEFDLLDGEYSSSEYGHYSVSLT